MEAHLTFCIDLYILHHKLRRADATNPVRDRALLGGMSASRQNFTGLPGAKAEIEAISQLIPHEKIFDERFNDRLVATNLVANNSSIVHFATHGKFGGTPEETFILTWDSQIGLDRLSNLLKERGNRSTYSIDLLVLSACETAKGDNRATLGLAGVAIKARAKSTIASLWQAGDESTQELMTQLYQNMLVKKLSKGESLRMAQQASIQNPKFRSPYYWAPFVLVGNWQ